MTSSVHKKRSLLVDALRYTNKFTEASKALAAHFVYYVQQAITNTASSDTAVSRSSSAGDSEAAQKSIAQSVPFDTILAMWIKLKRGAIKADGSLLQVSRMFGYATFNQFVGQRLAVFLSPIMNV